MTMDIPSPAVVLATLEIGGVVEVVPVAGGMSGALLWRVRREPPQGDLLLRLFPHSGLPTVEHEAAAQRCAFAGGVPTPRIDFVGMVAGCPVIVLEWLAGRTMQNVLFEQPERADSLGRASGQLLGRIHALPPTVEPLASGTLQGWLTGLDEWLVEQVVARPGHPSAVIHGDFHPGNLLVHDDGSLSVLDWTNASVGDPLIDLGRTFACLQLGAALYAGTIGSEQVDACWRGLVAGYGAAERTIDQLAPFFAFGLATLVDDRQRTQDDAVPADAVGKLILRRDSWLGLAQRVSSRP